MKSMKQQAAEKAQELGVELTYEVADDMIEVWSFEAHLTEDPIGQTHTNFVHRETWDDKKRTDSAMWREVLRYMTEDLVPCASDCECQAGAEK